ncbi:MAG: MBL fold metallo-hydrolase [Pirellulales bacterium]|nr:MBL fold metallo-hydrolase [Pirellulales bacterium]
MVDNVPVMSTTFKDLTIEGYSRAAVQSYWRIPELKVGFDLGAQPWSFMGTSNWFISHGHLDHIAAAPVYIARRRMMKMDPPIIYLPESTVDPLQKILRLFSHMDRGRMPCELIAVKPGDEIALSRELVVTVSESQHTVPALAFIVWERRKKLKPEYLELPGDKIRDLRKSGVEITHEIRRPRLAYTGDTAPAGLDRTPALFEAEVLITEMTFAAPRHRKEKIHKYGHMHLDDFIERRDKFKNELIIVSHVSTRYNDRQARRFVEKRLPDMLDGRLKLWI